MHSPSDEINRYYELGLEADRLSTAERQLESLRTQHIVKRFLPGEHCVVLDVGGGPGGYSCWLAQEGHEVHLINPLPLYLAQAMQASELPPEKPITSIGLGEARGIGFPDQFADVALLLGSLYHLTKRSDRIAALKEVHRVLKPGGVLIGVGICRFASALVGLIYGYLEDPEFVQIIRQDLKDGQHRNPTETPRYLTEAYFHHPEELEREVSDAGLQVVELLAIEGPAVFLQDLEEKWEDPDHRQRILDILAWLESDPSILGMTSHAVVIARKN